MARKDIRIKFEVDGRRYEAVGGFLGEREKTVSRDTMFKRTDRENGGAIGEEDTKFLSERRHMFPKRLERYNLFSNVRSASSGGICCFHMQCGKWSWGTLYGRLDKRCLVLRRLL